MKIWSIALTFLLFVTGATLAGRYWISGEFNLAFTFLVFFLAANILNCYWEISLLRRADTIEERRQRWDAHRANSTRSPPLAFLTMPVPLRRALSPDVWADLWGVYSLYDPSYANKESYSFNIDSANGVATPILSLLLLATFAIPFLPARVAGILGVLLFWQWIYTTSLYLVTFYTAGRHLKITGRETLLFVWMPNLVWILFPLFGFYVSVRLILNGSYSVLGLN